MKPRYSAALTPRTYQNCFFSFIIIKLKSQTTKISETSVSSSQIAYYSKYFQNMRWYYFKYVVLVLLWSKCFELITSLIVQFWYITHQPCWQFIGVLLLGSHKNIFMSSVSYVFIDEIIIKLGRKKGLYSVTFCHHIMQNTAHFNFCTSYYFARCTKISVMRAFLKFTNIFSGICSMFRAVI